MNKQALHKMNENFGKVMEILDNNGITDKEIRLALPVIIAWLCSGMDEADRDEFIDSLIAAVREVDEIARRRMQK